MTQNALTHSEPIDQIDHFRREASKDIQRMLIAQVGREKATKAASRIGLALASAVRSARNPSAIMSCSRGSIVQCVANACAVDLYPRATNSPIWLVPKGGELQFWISHVGLCILAYRAGVQLRAIPVHVDDDYHVEFEEVAHHRRMAWPKSLDDLAGVYVTARRISDGALMGRPWLPIEPILDRKRMGSDNGPWKSWPVEMAQKTAIKYLVARGAIVIDSRELDTVLDAEPREDFSTAAGSVPAQQAVPVDGSASEFLGLPDNSAAEAIEDAGLTDLEPEPAMVEEEPAPEPKAKAEKPKPSPTGGKAPARRRRSKGAP